MIIIGIDFSINSTALTIRRDDEFLLFSFVPNLKRGRSAFKTHEFLEPELEIISYEKENSSKDSFDDQQIKLKNAHNLSDKIIQKIEEFTSDDIEEVRIEGFSYASKGNSFIDLIVFNTFLKVKIIQRWGHIIRVVPPKTLKKIYTGNGNASKCDMIRHFDRESTLTISKKIRDLDMIREEDFTVLKPIDDLVDSVGLVSISF